MTIVNKITNKHFLLFLGISLVLFGAFFVYNNQVDIINFNLIIKLFSTIIDLAYVLLFLGLFYISMYLLRTLEDKRNI